MQCKRVALLLRCLSARRRKDVHIDEYSHGVSLHSYGTCVREKDAVKTDVVFACEILRSDSTLWPCVNQVECPPRVAPSEVASDEVACVQTLQTLFHGVVYTGTRQSLPHEAYSSKTRRGSPFPPYSATDRPWPNAPRPV